MSQAYFLFLHSICKRSSVRPDLDVLRFCYHPESADLAESNGSLPPCGWLTAGTLGSAPGLTLGNKYAKPLPFIFRIHYKIFYTAVYSWESKCIAVVISVVLSHTAWKTLLYVCLLLWLLMIGGGWYVIAECSAGPHWQSILLTHRTSYSWKSPNKGEMHFIMGLLLLLFWWKSACFCAVLLSHWFAVVAWSPRTCSFL